MPSWSEKAYEMVCCGFSFNVNVTKVNQQRSKTMIALTNRYFWLHFLIVLFNLGDLVKDITFTAAVQHFDTNIVQAYETETSTGDKVSYLYPLIILLIVSYFNFRSQDTGSTGSSMSTMCLSQVFLSFCSASWWPIYTGPWLQESPISWWLVSIREGCQGLVNCSFNICPQLFQFSSLHRTPAWKLL